MEEIIGSMVNGHAQDLKILSSLIDSCNKFKVTRHHTSREKRPLRYPPYGPRVAIPKEVPILGAETRVAKASGIFSEAPLHLPLKPINAE